MFEGKVEDEMNNPMPELKTGMVLELDDGDLMMVFKDTPHISAPDLCCDHVAGPNGWGPIGMFDVNGVYNTHTIMKIYCPAYRRDFGKPLDEMNKTLIWERKEEPAKKMTVAEVAEALGYKVEIVDG